MKNLLTIILTLAFSISAFAAGSSSDKKDSTATDQQQEENADNQDTTNTKKKDDKKVDELAQKADDMGNKIGPEFVALMDGLQDMAPDSKEAGEIGAMLEVLDKLCAKK